MNIRNLGKGKFEDIVHEMDSVGLDMLVVTQTTLRGNVMEVDEIDNYKFIGKGREKIKRSGGGVGIIYNCQKGVILDEIDVESECKESEDIAVFRAHSAAQYRDIECILVVCYMTVDGPNMSENVAKYRVLLDIVEKYRSSNLIVLGDMNGHTGILGERTNYNGELLMDFAENAGLEILNHTIAEGKVTWSNRISESAIDYVLVNQEARSKVQSMVVDEEGIIDIDSDHNALLFDFGKYNDQENSVSVPNGFSNNRKKPIGRTDFYWQCRDKPFDGFEVDLAQMDMIEGVNAANMNDNLIGKLNKVAAKNFKKVRVRDKKKSKNKSWWNAEIEVARKSKKEENRKLRKTTKNYKRGLVTEAVFQEQKGKFTIAKAKVTALISKAIRDQEKRDLQKVRQSSKNESRDWYKFIRGDKNGTLVYPSSLKVNGVKISDREEIRTEIEKFWTSIAGKSKAKMRYSGEIHLLTERKDIEVDLEPPTYNEIREVIKGLKNGKGVGVDGVPYEFFKFGGEWIVEALYDLFKRVWEDECIPLKWNESKVILLHKGGNRSKEELKNFRPISMGNTVGKVFSCVINERLKIACENAGLIGEEQNGFRQDRRGEDNIYVIRELVEDFNRRNKCLYLAFLDIEKAYDKVNRQTLIYVLDKLGIPRKISNLVKGMYTNTKAKYIFGDIETEWVHLDKGVRQGCVLSPLLFSIYTEELATRIRLSGKGVRVEEDRLGALLYADDIVLIAESASELQEMLDISFEFASEFSLTYSTGKCGVLSINVREPEGVEFKLGQSIVDRVEKYTYLGVLMDEKGAAGAKRERIFKANQWWGRLCAVSKFRADKYEVTRGLWKGIAVPSIMYGMETMNWSAEEIRQVEVIQNKIGRLALGANKMVGTEAIRGDMGWSSFEERLFKGKMRYKIRLEKMPSNRWASKVYRMVGIRSTWILNCASIVRKCGLHRRWTNMEWNNKEWEITLSPGDETLYSTDRWKGFINDKVQEYGLNKWRRGIEKKSTLHMYGKKVKPNKELFYNGDWGSSLLFKARSGSLELNSRTYRYNENRDKKCRMCNLDNGVDETIHHVMIECTGYEEPRDWLRNKIHETMGEGEFAKIIRMEGNGIKFLLGLDEDIPIEVIEATKSFLSKIWAMRRNGLPEGLQMLGSLPFHQVMDLEDATIRYLNE